MKKLQFFFSPIIWVCLLIGLSYGCKSKPSNDEIKKCILNGYTCGESAKINSLTVVNSREKEVSGGKGYEFIVNYEIEFTSDCPSTTMSGVKVFPGFKKSYTDKKVFLGKMDKGWTCE